MISSFFRNSRKKNRAEVGFWTPLLYSSQKDLMKSIITKYLEETATEAEKAALLEWLRKKENRLVFEKHKADWKNGLQPDSFPGDGAEVWNEIQSRLLEKNYTGWQQSRKIGQLLRYAAIFFFLLSIGTVSYVVMHEAHTSTPLATRVIAENGQISKVVLPDGSLVWLNSGSTLTYGNNFAATDRNLHLEGEAYFQIAQNKKIPLVVGCDGLQVKVTGTAFNVTAYPHKNKISVVLEEGSVELTGDKNKTFAYSLRPGELAEFSKTDKRLSVSKTNPYKYTSWKEGIINIYDQTLEEVVERLKNRYNQEFELTEEVKSFHYTFTIKNEPLQDIIGLMEKITPIKAEQNGEVITFKLDKNKLKIMNN